MYTLLHISDLHRSSAEPVSNDELISSLLLDQDRYVQETPAIQRPQALIVSGDIIQGARLGDPDSLGQLSDQYDVAYRFLSELASRLFAGDHSKVVIVPGNHDVDWNTARSSMEAVTAGAEPADLKTELARPGSQFRWCWRTRAVYRVVDQPRYDARLDAFWSFFDRFYSGLALPCGVNPTRGFNVFELNSGEIGVVGYNSCHGNDCFSSQGAVPDGAVGRSHLVLRDLGRRYALKVAVWHHSVTGPPSRSDYMDIETVYDMIGGGFRLGLHGHQHRTDATPHYIHLPETEMMVVVSAGSLCAGARELPRGVNRQYNIIEINDDYSGARVHVRTMLTGTMFGQSPLQSFGGRSHVEVQWQPPRTGTNMDEPTSGVTAAVLEAETAIQRGDRVRAITLLLPLRNTLAPYGRRLLLTALTQEGRLEDIIQLALPPQTIEELVMLADALTRRRRFSEAKEVLDKFRDAVGLPPALYREAIERVEAQRTIHNA